MSAEVLIVGAGPTGLVLALWLTRLGVIPRIIDRSSGPGQQSRAMGVQARTLEFYRQLGYADELIYLGTKLKKAHLREDGVEILTLPFEDLGAGLSPYPFAFCLAQDDHERFLTKKLHTLGVVIEWDTELREFTQDAEGVDAVIVKSGREEVTKVAFLCGCDGARSRVREVLQLGFPGGIYDRLFYVADVRNGEPWQTDLFVDIGDKGLVLMFPVRSSGMQRLIGTLPESMQKSEDAGYEDIRASVESVLPLKVIEVNWFSAYRVHHRVADHFQKGRVFIAGDAGHIHSPAGGQGMNTGIGDAVNLAWKLAAVVKGKAHRSLLDTYEVERIAFARSLIKSTDRAFQALVGNGWGDRFLRRRFAPAALPILTRLTIVKRLIFKTVSQTRIHYHPSALSSGKAGKVQGGDRLPWVPYGDTDNFAPLKALDWGVHVYGRADQEFAQSLRTLRLPLFVFPHSPEAADAGLLRDAMYLVRPDGHVALASAGQSSAELSRYTEAHGLRF